MPPERSTRTKTLTGTSELTAWLGVPRGVQSSLEEVAKLLDRKASVACDTAHRESINRVVTWNSKNSRPIAQDDMLALTQNDKTRLLQCSNSIEVIDAGNLGQD